MRDLRHALRAQRLVPGTRKDRMIETVERMLSDLEHGKLSRRQLAVSLAALAAGAYAVPAALATPAPTGFRAVTINHVTVRVPDLHRTSRFYQEFFGMRIKQQSATVHILGVGGSFFGIEQGESKTAAVDHYDFGIVNFDADAVRAKLRERGLKFSDLTSKESFKFYDPDGFQVQVNGTDYVGHVS
jgi:catechol 2,3-dioxygenase-like lactoylglutathione lyase family enzyme